MLGFLFVDEDATSTAASTRLDEAGREVVQAAYDALAGAAGVDDRGDRRGAARRAGRGARAQAAQRLRPGAGGRDRSPGVAAAVRVARAARPGPVAGPAAGSPRADAGTGPRAAYDAAAAPTRRRLPASQAYPPTPALETEPLGVPPGAPRRPRGWWRPAASASLVAIAAGAVVLFARRSCSLLVVHGRLRRWPGARPADRGDQALVDIDATRPRSVLAYSTSTLASAIPTAWFVTRVAARPASRAGSSSVLPRHPLGATSASAWACRSWRWWRRSSSALVLPARPRPTGVDRPAQRLHRHDARLRCWWCCC